VKFACAHCRVRLNLSPADFPFTCACGASYASPPAGTNGRGKASRRPAAPVHGPGAELLRLVRELRIGGLGCACNSAAAQMDAWGLAGCRARRTEISGWLLEAGVRIRALADPPEWLDCAQPGASLVDEAIRRADAAELARLAPLVAELRGPALARDPDWHLARTVIDGHRRLLDEAASAAAAAVPPTKFAGRGIVTLGGTSKYFAAAWVLVSVLRRLGCTLPVEWWYLGPRELDRQMIDLAESLEGVTCIHLPDRLAEFGRAPRVLAGWEAKVWAIMYSRFAEVLFLDADQVPTADPAYLFDEPAYRDRGAVFWPDYPPHGWSVTATAFQTAGLPVPTSRRRPAWKNPTDYRPFETGQILLDKTRHWPALELTSHINDHSDFWFPAVAKGRHAWHVYGDKDTFYLAWERLRSPYAMPPACGFIGGPRAGAFTQRDFAGKILFQHRVQPARKWVLHGVNHAPPGFQHHDWCQAALDALRRQWPGHPYDAADETPHERSLGQALRGHKVWFRENGPPLAIDFAAGGKCAGDRHHHWSVRTFGGESPVLVLASFDRALAFLGPDDHGNWVNHGTGDSLVDAPPRGFDLPLAPEELAIWNDIARDNEYRLPPRFGPADVVLDIGGHCGIFAHAVLTRGAGRVVSVEPAPENFARLVRNLAPFGSRAMALPVAAWRCDQLPGAVRLGRPPGAVHSGGWSAVAVAGQGIESPSVPFSSLVQLLGRVRLVKLDCEGSEWPILDTFEDWGSVQAWCGEYHHALWPDADSRLRSIFAPHGYESLVLPHPRAPHLGHFWAWREPCHAPV